MAELCFIFYFKFLFMCMYVYVPCVCRYLRSLKRVSDLPKLDLQEVLSHPVSLLGSEVNVLT